MKKLAFILAFILVSTFVYADCITDVCNDPASLPQGCACSDGTLDDDCLVELCVEDTLTTQCKQELCTASEGRLAKLDITNQNDHNSFNIAINNLRTELNNIKSENSKIKDEMKSVSSSEQPSPLRQNLLLYIILTVIAGGLFILGISNKNKIKNQVKPSLSEEQKTQINNYVHTYSQSYSKEQISDALHQQGFTDDQIKEAKA